VKRLILKESEAQTTAARRTQCASHAPEEIRRCAARNSILKSWSHFFPFQKSTGSNSVKAWIHPSASLTYWVCPAAVRSKSSGTEIKSAIVTVAVSSHSTTRPALA